MYGISKQWNKGVRKVFELYIDFSKTALANRPGILSAEDEASYWGVPLATTSF
jgi:iron complex outermembrane receptor protein